MPRFMVERTFPEGVHIPMNDDGANTCMFVVATNTALGVTWIHSYIVSDLKKTFCLYDGPSAEAVRKASAANNLPIDRITPVFVLDPYFYRG